MKKIAKISLALTSLALFLTSCSGNNSSSEVTSEETSETTDTSEITESTSITSESELDEYYSSITDDMSGTTLLNALHNLNVAKRKKTIGYKYHRNHFRYTEQDPLNPVSGKMYGFYNSALVSASWDSEETWNHEHMWPKSRGGDQVEDDIHMVRPASKSLNSERGNDVFAASGAYDPGSYNAYYRGVSARIIFYCAIADTSLGLKDATSMSGKYMGKLSDLLKWNLNYAPSTLTTADVALRIEQNRNDVIYTRNTLQGNRNPFIDHPEYACRIWGSTNSTTKSICGM